MVSAGQSKIETRSSDMIHRLNLIALLVVGRLCLLSGGGVHQWNLTVRQFDDLIHVLYLAPYIPVLQTDSQVVDMARRDSLRSGYILDQNCHPTTISTNFCALKDSRSATLHQLLGNNYTGIDMEYYQHDHMHICLQPTRKVLEFAHHKRVLPRF